MSDPSLDTANCPRDLVPLIADGPPSAQFWRCPICGLVQLT